MSVFRYVYGARSYVGIFVYMELDPMSVSRYVWSQVLCQYIGIYGARSYVGIQVCILSLVLCQYLGICGARSYVSIQVYMELDPMSVFRYVYGARSYVGIQVYMELGPMSVSRYMCQTIQFEQVYVQGFTGIQILSGLFYFYTPSRLYPASSYKYEYRVSQDKFDGCSKKVECSKIAHM